LSKTGSLEPIPHQGQWGHPLKGTCQGKIVLRPKN
jgi:hypothetical protein